MSGIYIHIPFCRRKCIYCNFYSIRLNETLFKQYIELLLKEIRSQKDYLSDKKIDTIYFGGGTPSLLQSDQINRIIDKISVFYDISPVQEITLEANPDSLGKNYLEALKKETPVNRLSIGIQSFDDDDLKLLNRRHTAEQGILSIKNAQETGFQNISIDLIYGIPSLTNLKWLTNLKKGAELNVPHISSYALTVEPNTMLSKMIDMGKVPFVDENNIIKHFYILTAFMNENGYEHYEISNFARPGQYSKHNSSYWNNTHYLGLGASAHSYDGSSRQWNCADISRYMSALNSNIPSFEKEILTAEDQFNEYIMTRLRTSKGIDKHFFFSHFDKKFILFFEKNIKNYIGQKFVEENESSYKLTLEGKLFADKIAGDLFV